MSVRGWGPLPDEMADVPVACLGCGTLSKEAAGVDAELDLVCPACESVDLIPLELAEGLRLHDDSSGTISLIGFVDDVLVASHRAILRWGTVAEERLVYEEIGELLVALTHYLRGKGTAEDVLDEGVDLVLAGLHACALAGADVHQITERLEAKLERVYDRLEAAAAMSSEQSTAHVDAGGDAR